MAGLCGAGGKRREMEDRYNDTDDGENDEAEEEAVKDDDEE